MQSARKLDASYWNGINAHPVNWVAADPLGNANGFAG